MDAVCHFDNKAIIPKSTHRYNYLEIPDVSPTTGVISNIRKYNGNEIGDSFYVAHGGDLAYCRINPRKNRVFIIPEKIEEVLISKEAYIIKLNQDSDILDNYALAAILQSDIVKDQLVRLSTGSSSSRARVQEQDFLNAVYIPIPSKTEQKKLSSKMKKILTKYWETSQEFLLTYIECQKSLCTKIEKDTMNGV